MKKTQYYGLFKPEGTDAVDIQNFNDNFDAIDSALHEAADASGDLSKGKVYANTAASRSDINSGDTLGTVIGKVMKWFADLKDAAFAQIANNDTTTSSGYVLDARVGKTHGDEIDKHTKQLGGLYLGQNASGKWGYKTSEGGTVIPFRNPTGTAVAAQVLSGKTFSNASADDIKGTMPDNGEINKTLTPTGNNTVTYELPAGYTTGGTITANGATAYAAGMAVGKTNVINAISVQVIGKELSETSDDSTGYTLTIKQAGKITFYYNGSSSGTSHNYQQHKLTISSNGATYVDAEYGESDNSSYHATRSNTSAIAVTANQQFLIATHGMGSWRYDVYAVFIPS